MRGDEGGLGRMAWGVGHVAVCGAWGDGVQCIGGCSSGKMQCSSVDPGSWLGCPCRSYWRLCLRGPRATPHTTPPASCSRRKAVGGRGARVRDAGCGGQSFPVRSTM